MKPKHIAAIAIIACPTLALAQVSAGAGGTDGGAGGAKTGTTGPGIGTSDSGKSANGSAVRTDSNGGAGANGDEPTGEISGGRQGNSPQTQSQKRVLVAASPGDAARKIICSRSLLELGLSRFCS